MFVVHNGGAGIRSFLVAATCRNSVSSSIIFLRDGCKSRENLWKIWKISRAYLLPLGSLYAVRDASQKKFFNFNYKPYFIIIIITTICYLQSLLLRFYLSHGNKKSANKFYN